MKLVAGTFCTLVAFSAFADVVTDVKSAVVHLTAKQPVHGTFATEQTVKSAGKYANENTARAATADVTHDANGVSIVIPQNVIEKASEDSINTIRSTEIIEALNFRAPLLDLLNRATLKEEKRVLFGGKQTRLLVLSIRPTQRQQSGSIRIGSVKSDDQLRLWIGDDNLPLAGERVTTSTAGIMFLHGTYNSRVSYTFAHVADRLILARMESSDSGSGMGQNVAKTAVQTLTLR